jgi:hypothetical protein
MLRLMEHYEIRVVGHLDERRARALGCEELRRLSIGDSVLSFAALDQTALYGVLARLRDAGLALVSVRRTSPSRARLGRPDLHERGSR